MGKTQSKEEIVIAQAGNSGGQTNTTSFGSIQDILSIILIGLAIIFCAGKIMFDHLAVCVRNAEKSYEGFKILHNLSMSVEKSTIYGLLGASGCGKTTLLNCIIGSKCLDAGAVWTLGVKPGSKGSGVPGPKIGYMPQEYALILEYTVQETIYFFGRIANMKDDAISTRFHRLSSLLELPPCDQFVHVCSGGEQRRISLASAIVHEPELLILDEPTVGVDSILRDKIWNYLLDQVRSGTSVIMTTHYIEECRNATKVGLMRNGKLLAEQSPQAIMSDYECATLEQAFLKMCMDEDKTSSDSMESPDSMELMINEPSTSNSLQSLECADFESSHNLRTNTNKHFINNRTFLGINVRTLRALLDKNWKQITRNVLGLIFLGVLPVTEALFCLYCIGGDIKGLNLGIINYELPGQQCLTYDRQFTAIPNIKTYDCHFKNLGCRFLEYLQGDPMINTVTYDLSQEANEGVRHGQIIGFLEVPANFSESFEERFSDIVLDESTLEFATIKAYLDMSNKAIGGTLKYKLLDLFLDFQDDLYKDCLWDERLGRVPLKEEYLFGRKDDSFLIFMLPGIILTFGFYFGTTMSTSIIIAEKCEGTWERSLVAGVTTLELACGHFLLQVTVSIFHGVIPVLISLFIYGIEYKGFIFHMILISALQNICGLTLGFWISIRCKTHIQAQYMVSGIAFSSLMLSGLLWPLEGLPSVLQIVSKCLPTTLPIISLRNVIRKGWSLWDLEMICVNLIPVGWLVALVLISVMQIQKLH